MIADGTPTKEEVCPKCGHIVDWEHPEYFGGSDYDVHREACSFCARHPLKVDSEGS